MSDQAIYSPETADSKSLLISGFLNILWIEASAFSASKKRIVFRFFTGPSELLTLHGWTNDDDDTFPDDPDIIFNMGQLSNFKFGDKTYFGNLVLRRADRKKINTLIAAGNFSFVLFLPHDPANPNYPQVPPGQITYDIELTNDDPKSLLSPLISSPTKISLNPSPPRNSG